MFPPSESLNLHDLLGLRPSSQGLSKHIAVLSSLVSTTNANVPEIKSYPDAVYFNYFTLGLSLLFSPQNGYKPTTGLKKPDLEEENLVLDSMDVYNGPTNKTPAAKSSSARSSELAFSTYPVSPFILTLSTDLEHKDDKQKSRPSYFDITSETTGKDFVQCLGEPDRKGGGAGPSSGSIGIWCEWSNDGIMVEFGGDEARGPQAWERGKDAVWRVITLFPPKAMNTKVSLGTLYLLVRC